MLAWKQLAMQQDAANKALAELLHTLGERHPDVLSAQERSGFLEAQLKGLKKEMFLMSASQLADTGRIIPAEAGSVATPA